MFCICGKIDVEFLADHYKNEIRKIFYCSLFCRNKIFLEKNSVFRAKLYFSRRVLI